MGSTPTPALPVLSATSCSIQVPRLANRGVEQEREFVAPGALRLAEEGAEVGPGVLVTTSVGAAQRLHRRRAGQETVEVEPEQGRRDEPEEGQRREATADVRRIVEHGPETLTAGELVEGRAGIRDGHESAGRGALPEVPVERVDLDGAARLRRDDVERRVPLPVGGPDGGRNGGVEHLHVEETRGDPAAAAEHLGAEARTAHAQEPNGRQALGAGAFDERAHGVDLIAHRVGGAEPAEAIADFLLHAGVGRPDGRIAIPEADAPAFALGRFEAAGDGKVAGAEGREAPGGDLGESIGGRVHGRGVALPGRTR
jgi:hypothetical protein